METPPRGTHRWNLLLPPKCPHSVLPPHGHTPSPQATATLLSVSRATTTLDTPVSGIIPCSSLCDRLMSFSVMSPRPVYIVAHARISFLCKVNDILLSPGSLCTFASAFVLLCGRSVCRAAVGLCWRLGSGSQGLVTHTHSEPLGNGTRRELRCGFVERISEYSGRFRGSPFYALLSLCPGGLNKLVLDCDCPAPA